MQVQLKIKIQRLLILKEMEKIIHLQLILKKVNLQETKHIL